MSLAPSLTPDAKENAASRILAATNYYDVLGVGPPWTELPVNAARRTGFLEECQKAYHYQSKLICPDGSSTPRIDAAAKVFEVAWAILKNEKARKEYT